MVTRVSKSPEETAALADDFLAQLPPSPAKATVVGLYGDLGSGKTTFVQGLALALGLTESITSPTFVIEKIYRLSGRLFDKFIHVDAYRLESGAALSALGFHELLADGGNLIAVEWAERVQDVLGEHRRITFKFVDEHRRQISWG